MSIPTQFSIKECMKICLGKYMALIKIIRKLFAVFLQYIYIQHGILCRLELLEMFEFYRENHRKAGVNNLKMTPELFSRFFGGK